MLIAGGYRFKELPDAGLFRLHWHGNQEIIIVRSPQALADILVKNSYTFEKPDFAREFLAFIVGWALLTTEGDEHKKQRRNMLPAFSFRHIKDLYPLFWNKSVEVVSAMTEEHRQNMDADGYADMEISSWSVRSGLDIIGLAATGIDFGAVRDANNPLAQSYYCLNPHPSDFILLGLRAFLPGFIFGWLPLPRVWKVSKATKHLRQVCRELIADKQKKVANKEDSGVDILSVALRGNLFSDDELVDQMMTFLSAGHETTAASLVWALYLLAKHPDVQDRLRKEIRENLPSPDAASTGAGIASTDVDGLPYLNAVCSEALRTNSPVPATIRVAMENTTVAGQYIPKNTIFALPIWAINTDPQVWGEDAAEFRPERWLTPEQGGTSKVNAGSGGATSNYAFMTFIHGPHSCIGGAFSKSEMACLLAAWIGRFDFRLKDERLLDERNIQVNPSVVAKPEGGMIMRTKLVEGW